MPDYSYFPEGYEHTLFLPNVTNVSDVFKYHADVEAIMRTADAANIDYQTAQTMEGQLFGFKSSSDKKLALKAMEAKPVIDDSLVHVERFPSDTEPLYMIGWGKVVKDVMAQNQHTLARVNVDLNTKTATIEFGTQEAQQEFDKLSKSGDLIHHAIMQKERLGRDNGLGRNTNDLAADKPTHQDMTG